MRSFAIVPAAGRSTRMGQSKLLMPWNGATVIDAVLTAWSRSKVSELVVIVYREDSGLAEKCRSHKAHVVVSPTQPPDMKASVMLGIEFLSGSFGPGADDAWLLAPADMPKLTREIIDKVLDCHDSQRPRIVAPVCEGRRGHPVLFPWLLSAEVARLGEKEGVDALLERHPVLEMDCADPAVLQDIDSIDDYRRLHDRRRPEITD